MARFGKLEHGLESLIDALVVDRSKMCLLPIPESINAAFLIARKDKGETRACMQHERKDKNLLRATKPLAFLCVVQGTSYLTYFLWRALFSRMTFFRAPPGIIFLYGVYLPFVLFASLHFLYTSHRFFKGQRPVGKSFLVTSCLSAILWILPAILSFGNANTYLTNPNIPPETRARWVHYLWTGIFFSAIGTTNIATILNTIYHLRKPR